MVLHEFQGDNSLDVDWSRRGMLADILKIQNLAERWFLSIQNQTPDQSVTYGGDLVRMASCVDLNCPGECRGGLSSSSISLQSSGRTNSQVRCALRVRRQNRGQMSWQLVSRLLNAPSRATLLTPSKYIDLLALQNKTFALNPHTVHYAQVPVETMTARNCTSQ